MTAVVRISETASSRPSPEYVLCVRDLRRYFPIREGVMRRVTGQVHAVDGVSFDVRRGETVGLVGESGCGKSTLGRCIAGLTRPTSGGVYFGMDAERRDELDGLLTLGDARTEAQANALVDLTRRYRVDILAGPYWRHYRRNCQMVFQDSFSSMNPRQLVRDIVGGPLRLYQHLSGGALIKRVVELLEEVGLDRTHLNRYPHQFSGGQRQRISIARALALEPELVILDEPTSSLDVSVQAQILNLLHRLQKDHGLTYLFISHDLNVIRHVSDRIVVMYLGEISEIGPAQPLFCEPRHPYTEALLSANPALDDKLRVRLGGDLPNPANPPAGCRFHTRCRRATECCGWEVDDAMRLLSERQWCLSGLVEFRAASPFDAVLGFDSDAGAQRALAELQSEQTPVPLRQALVDHQISGPWIKIGFRPVEGVRLSEVADGRQSACILYQPPARHGE
jgi:oligopeptide/dipeptide ABC transporter ATP-binding protein